MDRRNLLRIAVVAAALLAGASVVSAAQPASAPESSVAFDPDAATRAYLAKVPAEEKARTNAYVDGGYWLMLWSFLYGAAVSLLLLYTGWSARLRDLAGRLTRVRFFRSFAYWIEYLVVTTVLVFPLVVYRDFFREHQYGLATQTFPSWAGDQAIALGVSALLGGLGVAVFYAVVRRAPRSWWLWGTGVAMLFVTFSALIAPVFINPLFNTYTRLEDPRIRDPILRLARAHGIETDAVYQMDASRQTTRISANVSGLLGTERITLNDNLLNRASLEEIEAVMGHEIGHYALNHVYEIIMFFSLVSLGGFAFAQWGFGRALERWGARWRVEGVADEAGLPLLLLLLSIYGFVLTPFINTFIRTNEQEADVFGLDAAREPDGFAEISLKLGEYRKLEPGPVEEWIFFDHPSGRTRIYTAMRWKAEMMSGRDPGVD